MITKTLQMTHLPVPAHNTPNTALKIQRKSKIKTKAHKIWMLKLRMNARGGVRDSSIWYSAKKLLLIALTLSKW